MKNQKTMGNKGFSLVELIVVIAIMAVLVGVLAPQFIRYVERSRISTDIQNVQQLKTAIEVDYAENETVSTVSIEFKGGSTKTAVASQPLTSIGSTTVKLKSGNWPDGPVTYTYTIATGTWSSSDFINTKDNTKNMKSVFN